MKTEGTGVAAWLVIVLLLLATFLALVLIYQIGQGQDQRSAQQAIEEAQRQSEAMQRVEGYKVEKHALKEWFSENLYKLVSLVFVSSIIFYYREELREISAGMSLRRGSGLNEEMVVVYEGRDASIGHFGLTKTKLYFYYEKVITAEDIGRRVIMYATWAKVSNVEMKKKLVEHQKPLVHRPKDFVEP
ncbi:MAG TPA: hypothetical protein VJ044_08555 [Candidatus Hodarchaeales archaeon]|nr:hypothetical protein [Candidatus Hodarchaeales archaeon]